MPLYRRSGPVQLACRSVKAVTVGDMNRKRASENSIVSFLKITQYHFEQVSFAEIGTMGLFRSAALNSGALFEKCGLADPRN